VPAAQIRARQTANSFIQSMPPPATPSSLWDTIKAGLKTTLPGEVFQFWIAPLVCLAATGDSITIGVANDFVADWINDNYREQIMQGIHRATSRDMRIIFQKHQVAPVAPGHDHIASATPAPSGDPRARRPDKNITAFKPDLNPRHTLQSFIVGPGNQAAHAAALAVAQAAVKGSAPACNPLFIHGGTGLGKTHLMHAIGHDILQKTPHVGIACFSVKTFAGEIHRSSLQTVRNKFPWDQIDLLLFEDIQSFSGRKRLQEEFLHLFDKLFAARKQIVISGDRRAYQIEKLDTRLVSRFECGLLGGIQAPDYETRRAILQARACALKFALPGDLAAFIAETVTQNIRQLEGALEKIASHTRRSGRPPDLPAAKILLDTPSANYPARKPPAHLANTITGQSITPAGQLET
jgi:chromosomal replication initiator protein